MGRFFLEIAYKGTDFHGWQIQTNAVTVQGKINDALSTLLGAEILTAGCGRTDTGVHASQYFLHFDMPTTHLPKNILYMLNSVLGKGIACLAVYEVEAEQHVRYDANYRAYDYFIHRKNDPFLVGLSTFYREQNLDVAKMRRCFSFLKTLDSFESFEKTNTDNNHSRCSIYRTQITFSEDSIRFHIAANRFLRGMVRLIVGSLLLVGRGKLTEEEFYENASKGERFSINWSVPAEGLYLSEIRYPYSLRLVKEERP
ncbi:tRNA pseudouridine(38-40) synthase TruA [Chitinophagales bacterium]|nr:tRNA pseudouridine(38-40) synthase TruA [Chitinophagales bacterium]